MNAVEIMNATEAPRRPAQARLHAERADAEQRFSVRHAYSMWGALFLAWFSGRTLTLAICTVLSLGYWVWEERRHFAGLAGFGAANTVTGLRALSLLPLAAGIDSGAASWAALWTLWIFTLDGIDGWLARRAHNVTAFGARFDSETDASLMLLLSAGVVALDRAGSWALIAGLLRFAYVLALHWSQRVAVETPRTRLGRYVFSIAVTCFTACLWPPQLLRFTPALAALATLSLCYSFSGSFRALWLREARDA